MAWKRLVDSESKLVFWKPEKEGETVVGTLISLGIGQLGQYLTLENAEEMICVNITAVMDRVVWENQIGRMFRFTYRGERLSPKSKQSYKLFDVDYLVD